MNGNIFGQVFQVGTFGESHGPAMGAVVFGCPSRVKFNFDLLQKNLARRRPGQSQIVSQRQEPDQVKVLSGVLESKTLGTPIALLVENKDARPEDYKDLNKNFRPGHADDLWRLKYGHSDVSGGGRASGRETIARVMAGSVAQMFLQQILPEYQCFCFCRELAGVALTEEEVSIEFDWAYNQEKLDQYSCRLPQTEKAKLIEEKLIEARSKGQSYGGVAEVWLKGLPAGLGQPVFRKLKSELFSAVSSIGATAAVELGSGFQVSEKEGSEFHGTHENPQKYGGIRGGISTGEMLVLRIYFKPTASVLDVAKKGRHDPCIVPRAVPVIEAMANLCIADQVLLSRLDQV